MPIYTEKRSVFLFFSSFDLKEKFLSAPRPKKNGKKINGEKTGMRRKEKKLELVWRKLFGIEKRTWRSTFIDCILTYSRLYPLPLLFFPLAFSVFPLFLVESSSYVALYLFPPFLFYFYFFAYLRFFTPTDVYVAMLSTMNAKNETTLLHRFCLWSPYLLLSGDSFFFLLFTSFLRLFVDICHRLWMHVRAQSDIFIYYSSEIEKIFKKERERKGFQLFLPVHFYSLRLYNK